MEKQFQPKSIEVSNSEKELKVQWADAHVSVYTLYGLRKNCPCVKCRGGHGEMGSYDRSYFFVDPPRKVKVENIKQVGNHAIRIYWSDGHSDGMYQWEMLRKLCPCEECYPEQE